MIVHECTPYEEWSDRCYCPWCHADITVKFSDLYLNRQWGLFEKLAGDCECCGSRFYVGWLSEGEALKKLVRNRDEK